MTQKSCYENGATACKRHADPGPRPSLDVYTMGNEGAILNIPSEELLLQLLRRLDEEEKPFLLHKKIKKSINMRIETLKSTPVPSFLVAASSFSVDFSS